MATIFNCAPWLKKTPGPVMVCAVRDLSAKLLACGPIYGTPLKKTLAENFAHECQLLMAS